MFQYARQIKLESHKVLGKQVLPVSSHFLIKFLKNGYEGVERWYKEVFAKMQRAEYYDSLYNNNTS